MTVDFTYDALERPLTKTFPNTIPGKVEDVAYTYDICLFGLGYVCARSDQSGDYDYDAFGNLTRDAEYALQALSPHYCAFHRSNLCYC